MEEERRESEPLISLQIEGRGSSIRSTTNQPMVACFTLFVKMVKAWAVLLLKQPLEISSNKLAQKNEKEKIIINYASKISIIIKPKTMEIRCN